MKEPRAYKGREQTYLKHYFLERYLERVAYNIGWGNSEFVYIDGFSGPWRSEDEGLEDTSFMIAIGKLREVRDALAKLGRPPKIRCIFVESDAGAFAELEKAVKSVTDLDVRVFHGEFEGVLPQIIEAVGDSFALTFIDPTGWTGFALDTISRLLEKRGEVLVNFMFDFVNRFRADDREGTAASMEALFGGPGWEEVVLRGEEEMLAFYCGRLRSKCRFQFATHTRVLKPLSDRTYFYLVYATRHPKGLVEFRAVEQRFLREQEQVRASAKQSARVEKSRQAELFEDAGAEGVALQEAMARSRSRSGEALLVLLDKSKPLRFEDVLPKMLETPMVDKPAAKRVMIELRDAGLIEVEGMKPRQRLPDDGCLLRLK